jgi:heat shock protein HslJ
MPDLEQTVRQTLTARVSHLTDEQLSADRRPQPAAPSPHSRLRTFLLPAAAAIAVAGVVIAVLFALNGGGKHHQAGSTAPSLVNTQWRLTSITQQGHTTTIPATIHPTLKLDDTGKARGNDGCNWFGTSVAINGSAITFSGGDVTDIRCADWVDAIERQYLNALAKVSQWSTSNGTLRLTGPDGLSLIFNAD